MAGDIANQEKPAADGRARRGRTGRLSADELARGLETAVIGRRIYVFDLVISTNDVLWELADRGAEEGTAVFAEEQTRGRGRLGRSWWSPRGRGIWMSVLLRPPLREESIPMTTILGALAASDAIHAVTMLPVAVRWPNDVLVEGRKAAGVLAEARQSTKGRELVLGIGMNVNVSRSEMPPEIADAATSLSEATGEPVDRTELARCLLAELNRWYERQLAGQIEEINLRWRALSATLGRNIVLEEHGRRYEGTVIDVDASLGLALRLGRGTIRHFRGEHVTVVKHG